MLTHPFHGQDVGGLETSHDTPNTPAPNAGDTANRVKLKATCAAQLALMGCSLHELLDGSFIFGRWISLSHAPDFESVEQLLRRAST